MLVPWWSLNGLHKSTAQYNKGVEKKRQRLAAEEAMAVASRTFSAYRRTLEMVSSLKFPGRVLWAADYDWSALIRNLTKVRVVWRRMWRILSREGAMSRVHGFLFKAVAQSVLLFGTEMWMVTPHMGQVLGVFQYQVERRLMGRLQRQISVEGGSTPQRRRQERRQGLSRWKPTFGKCRIWSRIILPRDQLWNCERRQRVSGGNGWG